MNNIWSEKPQAVQSIAFQGSIPEIQAVQWSENNDISFITTKGIHIFQLIVSPYTSQSCLTFNRTLLPNLKEPNLRLETDIDRGDLHNTLNMTVLCKLLLSRTYSPRTRSGDISCFWYKTVQWSPPMTCDAECVLATLTYDFQLHLWMRNGSEWTVMCDVSAAWEEQLQKTELWNSCLAQGDDRKVPSDIRDFEEIEVRSSMLAFQCFSWSDRVNQNGKEFCFLLAGNRKGMVVVFKMNLPFSYRDSVVMIGYMNTNLGIIASLSLYQFESGSFVLLAGSQNGLLLAYNLTLLPEEIRYELLGSVWDKSDNMITTFPSVHLIKKHQDGSLLFLVIHAKNNFLIVSSISWCVSDIGSFQLHSQQAKALGSLPVSGIISLPHLQFIIASGDGVLYRVKLELGDSISNVILLSESLILQEKGTVSYCGIVASPNQTLFAYAERLAVDFDHLTVREPCQLYFMMFGDARMTHKLLETPSQGLASCGDILENLRLCYCAEGASTIDIGDETLEELGILSLKLRRWLTLLKAECGAASSKEISGIAQMEKFIFRKTMVQRMSELLAHTDEFMQCKNSLNCYFPFLRHWINAMLPEYEPACSKVLDTLKKTLISDTVMERDEACPICSSGIVLESHIWGKCKNGHQLPRCSTSQRICSEFPYRVCNRCNAFASPNFDLLPTALCILCDGVLKPA